MYPMNRVRILGEILPRPKGKSDLLLDSFIWKKIRKRITVKEVNMASYFTDETNWDIFSLVSVWNQQEKRKYSD